MYVTILIQIEMNFYQGATRAAWMGTINQFQIIEVRQRVIRQKHITEAFYLLGQRHNNTNTIF